MVRNLLVGRSLRLWKLGSRRLLWKSWRAVEFEQCLRRLVTFRCTAWSMEIPRVACYSLMSILSPLFFTKEAELWLQLTWKWLAVPARIYMIGDNPAADVRGANSAGDPWRSILVCTGEVCFPGDFDILNSLKAEIEISQLVSKKTETLGSISGGIPCHRSPKALCILSRGKCFWTVCKSWGSWGIAS